MTTTDAELDALRDDIKVDVEAWRDGRYPLQDLINRILVLTRTALREENAELRRQRGVLADAIAELAIRAGILEAGHPLDGPQLLMLLNDMAGEFYRLRAELDAARKVAEAAKALKFDAYPAHGSGFVMIVSEGSISNFEHALRALTPEKPDAE